MGAGDACMVEQVSHANTIILNTNCHLSHRQLNPGSSTVSAKRKRAGNDMASSEDDMAQIQACRAANEPRDNKNIPPQPGPKAPANEDNGDHGPRRPHKGKWVSFLHRAQSPDRFVDEDDAAHGPHRSYKGKQVISRPPPSPEPIVDEDDHP